MWIGEQDNETAKVLNDLCRQPLEVSHIGDSSFTYDCLYLRKSIKYESGYFIQYLVITKEDLPKLLNAINTRFGVKLRISNE